MGLPAGTVTFLFTDVEGSTKLLHELGAKGYADALAEHRRVLREAVGHHGGVEVDTQGDAFFCVFPRASDAVAAALEAQQALAGTPVRVRMGIHTGEPIVTDEGYVGVDVHRGARITAAGHGGQVLLSQTTRDLIVGEVELRDLGEHRLKDLTAPQRLYQVGQDEFPRLYTLHQTNLPVQPTPLIGRERELAEVAELLRDRRLVTLVGPGGSGKTRLALQVAADTAEEFQHGSWWVSLAPLSHPELVEPTIAQAVGARDGLDNHLRSWRALLLLDNFEHVLAAAPRVATLLAEAPHITLLVTSRAPLRVAAEQEYSVPPLAADEAVAFFTERARALEPSFQPDEHVGVICRRLEGLPLALELAAARTRTLPPAKLVERLDRALPLLTGGARDAPERQRTLRATLDWSWGLLEDEAQRLFARLAVFAGSFSLEAAEEVCEVDLDTLEALVELNLVSATDGRYRLLSTIREFGFERLGSERDEIRGRLARWLEGVVTGARDQFLQGDSDAVSRVLAEVENALDAIEWAVEHDRALALRLLQELGFALGDAGLRQNVRRWLERVYRSDDSPAFRARALQELLLATRHDDYAAAERYAELWLAAARELGEPAAVATALHGAGLAALRSYGSEADLDAARRHLTGAIELARGVGGRASLAAPLVSLGIAEGLAHEYDAAVRHLEEAAAISAEIGRVSTLAICKQELADLEMQRGAPARAAAALREAIELQLRTHSRGGIGICLDTAACLAAEGDPELAARLLGAADPIVERVGGFLRNQGGPGSRAQAVAAGRLGGRFDTLRSEGRSLEEACAVSLARAYLDSIA